MIVNTAYIYMGIGGGGGGGDTPVNPNLWQDGVANYPVTFTTHSSISSDGVLLANGGSATFSELQLTDYNSLTISRVLGGFAAPVDIKIEFLNGEGQLLGKETAAFKNSMEPQTVNIPGSAKIQNAKIRMTNTSKMSPVTLSSAVLS